MKESQEKEFIELILSGELGPEEITKVENLFDQIKYFDFRPLVKRIFDMNDSFMLNGSEADQGLLGKLNKRGRKKKNRNFFKKITSHPKEKKENEKVIIAEGDSWFEFPIFVKDIIDWIINITDYSVYSLAYGGDWIGNILYSGDYIHELSLYLPDVFLLSGGGNDLVGNKRLAILVEKREGLDIEVTKNDNIQIDTHVSHGMDELTAEKIVIGKKFLNKDFWATLNVFRFQYLLILKNIQLSKKFDNMKIITHGYDFPIPSSNRNIFKHPLRWFNKNGKWLDEPLRIRGIHEPFEQQAILTAMIHEFNEMLIDLSKKDKNKNLYHIDCRGFASENYWLDELHLKSKYYKEIAKIYVECIESSDTTKKVFKLTKKQKG